MSYRTKLTLDCYDGPLAPAGELDVSCKLVGRLQSDDADDALRKPCQQGNMADGRAQACFPDSVPDSGLGCTKVGAWHAMGVQSNRPVTDLVSLPGHRF